MQRMFAAFIYRDFRVQWFGACTSSIGTWTQSAAQSWMVMSLTGSAGYLGLDAFLQQLPIMLFTLVGAVLADRRDRRRGGRIEAGLVVGELPHDELQICLYGFDGLAVLQPSFERQPPLSPTFHAGPSWRGRDILKPPLVDVLRPDHGRPDLWLQDGQHARE